MNVDLILNSLNSLNKSILNKPLKQTTAAKSPLACLNSSKLDLFCIIIKKIEMWFYHFDRQFLYFESIVNKCFSKGLFECWQKWVNMEGIQDGRITFRFSFLEKSLVFYTNVSNVDNLPCDLTISSLKCTSEAAKIHIYSLPILNFEIMGFHPRALVYVINYQIITL
jgi:hypothetical protein